MSAKQNEKEQKKISGKCDVRGNSPAVQWLGYHSLTAEGLGSTPGWGTKIPQAAWSSQKQFFFKLKKCDVKKDKRMFQDAATVECVF